MKTLNYAIAIILLSQTAALADACQNYDQKVTAQFSGPISRAATACQKTSLLIKMMKAALRAPAECMDASDRSKLKAGIAQSIQSFKDQQCQ
ncbi:hypothetical protein CK228_22865 [Mesorhizobium sp. WSM4312]|uniref:hypothetical protein n=1 Tax=Mesorhizobium sp. WSM4312 TaxID=2029411 RepID=UPI000BAE7312|nr:hypothetical protein [Mesorhizobium sp. WSM4312]PBB66392.1 hypothetical protein CK228_22865 [Mesorhizobium sp. WSM4312]